MPLPLYETQRRYDMRHEMLTQHALFCIDSNTKKGTLSQQFVTHVAPPLPQTCPLQKGRAGEGPNALK